MSNFQSSTTKLNNQGHPTVETEQVWPLGWFQKWFYIFFKKKLKLIHLKSKKNETGTKTFSKNVTSLFVIYLDPIYSKIVSITTNK